MSQSLFEAIRDNILQQHLDDRTKVHPTLTSKEHANNTVQSGPYSDVKYGIPVNEFLKRCEYVHILFDSLAQKMNSAPNMNPAIGFNATLTFVTYPEKKGKAQPKTSQAGFHMMHKKKDCMIKIDNSDELCCARAIVTMNEYVDGDPDKQNRNRRDGRPIQERLAEQFHREAGVKEGPCGVTELEKFQAYLGRQGYKLIVVDYVSSAILFRGSVEDYCNVIYLVKHEAPYNGLRSMITFLNRSYICPDCCKGYNQEDAPHHNCLGRNCLSCQRTSSWKGKGGCPHFKPGKTRTIYCKDCQRDFYGENCYKAHEVKKGKNKLSLSEKRNKCLVCCAHYEVKP